jgi:hypothetical protein
LADSCAAGRSFLWRATSTFFRVDVTGQISEYMGQEPIMGSPFKMRTAAKKPTAPAARRGRGQGQDLFSDAGLDGMDFLAMW